MSRSAYKKELFDFLESGESKPVFWLAKDLGWITHEEWQQALQITGEAWNELQASMTMFVLLAEGEEF